MHEIDQSPKPEKDAVKSEFVDGQDAAERPSTLDRFELLERDAVARHESALKNLGFDNPSYVSISANDPKYDEFQKLSQQFRQEMQAAYGVLPLQTPEPLGWEHPSPDREIKTLAALAEYLHEWLERFRHMRPYGEHDAFFRTVFKLAQGALRNAHRGFDHLKILDRPAPPLSTEFNDPYCVESALSELLAWARKADLSTNGQSTQKPSLENRPKKLKRRGRRVDTDLQADQRVFNAWDPRRFKTYEECARELGMSKHAFALTIDRVRKRKERRTE